MRETPKAQQAFERYWELGDGRSLQKLAEVQIPEDFPDNSTGQTREQAVEAKRRQLARWSSEHGWQDRLKERIAEESRERREKERERADRTRRGVTAGIARDLNRYLQELEISGESLAAGSAADLERLTKLYFQLVGQPLADRHELTGEGGGPVEIVSRFAHMTDEELAAFLAEHDGSSEGGAGGDGPAAD